MQAAPPYPDIAAEIRSIGPQIEVARTTQLYRTLHPVNVPSQVTVTRDVRYGPHERHVLDLFMPRERPSKAALPMLLYVHGGGFRTGSKQLPDQPFYDNIGVWAARAGLIGVTMSYRLAPEFVYPAGADDLGMAVAQISALAGDCGANPAQIFLWGHSAGGAHVADYITTHATPRIAGAILTSGIFDRSGATNDSPWGVYYGSGSTRHGPPSSIPGLVTTPVPLLVTWAEYDRADFIADAKALTAARARAGRPVATLELAGHSHISEIFAVGTADTSLTQPILEFIRTASEEKS
jgi:acetyl esterase/lipase